MKTASLLHRFITALLVCVLCGANVFAQDEAKDAAPPTATQPSSAKEIPDISGTWLSKGAGEFVVARDPKDANSIVIGDFYRLKWNAETQSYEGEIVDPNARGVIQWTIKTRPDSEDLQVTWKMDAAALKFFAKLAPGADVAQFQNQTWTRKKKAAEKNAATDAKMPDISGNWSGANWGTIEFRWVVDSPTKAYFSGPYGDGTNTPRGIVVLPLFDAQQAIFTGTWYESPNRHGRVSIRVLPPDGKTIRGTWTTDAGSTPKTGTSESGDLEWTRPKPSRNVGGLPATASTPIRSDFASQLPIRAVPNTPEAKQLLERLHAQESAAASEAELIRQLPANGPAEPNQRALAEHQRKLTNLLSTAFDLKLQWEELQVQELQSRLSQLDRQIGQRKQLREKIIARRTAELIEGEALKWSPDVPSAETRSSNAPPNAATSTLDEMRVRLEAVGKRAAAAEERVRELEAAYWQDRSRAPELQQAMDELTKTRREWGALSKEVHPLITAQSSGQSAAAFLVVGLEKRLQEVNKRLAEGKATEAEVTAAATAYAKAQENYKREEAKYEALAESFDQLMVQADIGESATYRSASSPDLGLHPTVAMTWLEATTRLKLEFVRFDDLKFWFKSALRVREASEYYKAGDLIVVLNGHTFETLDEAITVLKPGAQSGLSSAHLDTKSIILSGGLAGRPGHEQLNRYSWQHDMLKPTEFGNGEEINLEVRVRRAGTDELETQYVVGTCVSPDGLVVIPVSRSRLDPEETIDVIFNPVISNHVARTARVVAADDAHGLTLLKLESKDERLFAWRACRTGAPTIRQQLYLNLSAMHGKPSGVNVAILGVGEALPKPLVGNDAFFVDIPVGLKSVMGDRLVTLGRELQGIVIASGESPVRDSPDKPQFHRLTAIPAVHVQKLIDDYCKVNSPETAMAVRGQTMKPGEATSLRTVPDEDAVAETAMKPDGFATPSYQEFAKKLATMNRSVTDAEEVLLGTQRLAERGTKSSDDVKQARQKVEEAIRSRKATQDEYAAVLRDLELQVESAQLELDAATKFAERVEKAFKHSALTQQEVNDSQLRMKQAKLTLERLKVRHDLYKKAGEGITAQAGSETKLNLDPLSGSGNARPVE